MKFSNIINSLALFLVMSMPSAVISNLYADATQPQKPETEQTVTMQAETPSAADKKAKNDLAEQNLAKTLELYKKLDFTLESLAQVVNNNQVRNCDKAKAIEHIKMLRFNLAQLQANGALASDAVSIKLLNVIFKGLAQHLRDIIRQNFTQFPEPDLEPLVKRTLTNTPPSFDSIQSDIEANEKLMKAIESEANRIGLSILNRMYRRAEKFTTDHSVLSKVGALLAAGVLGYLIIASIPEGLLSDKLNKTRQDVGIGQTPKYSPVTGEITNGPKILTDASGKVLKDDAGKEIIQEGALKVPGYLQYWGESLGVVKLTLPPLITWELLKDPLKDRFDETKKWMSRKWEVVRAYLRGGPVIRKTDAWMIEPRYTFDDVIGKTNIKEKLMQVVEYFKNREKFNRSGMKPQKGFLFAGDSRTGKSFMAEALAGELKKYDFRFLNFNAADVLSYKLPVIMGYARYYAPCVLFIDEIDMLGAQRDRNAVLLSELLTAMSGVTTDDDESKPVIILAATNAPQNLDFALLQPGRFEKTLWFMQPSFQERKYFLMRELDKLGIMTVNPDYLEKLAQETEGVPFEALRRIVITALQHAYNAGETLNELHLEQAFDEETRLILFEDPRLPQDEKHLIAVHQAGHALATMLLEKGSQRVAKVTICPVNIKPKEEPTWMKYMQEKDKPQETVEHGKVFTAPKNGKGTYNSHEELIIQCKIDLAGHVAEKLLLGSTGYTYHRHDNQKALAMAKYIMFKGMKETELPKAQCAKLQEAYELLERCEKEVTELLAGHKEKIETTAQALEKYLSLDGYHLELIMQGKPLVAQKVEQDEKAEEKPAVAPAA